ncbi:MAG: hypothetical protein LBV38_04010 [Alistipes sp.]|jgi:hypothetical protein|nr:hypothetical protein [Alistipes sp.]
MKRPTIHEKELARLVADLYGHLPTRRVVEELCRMGVIDHRLCKILAVRRKVDDLMAAGHPKIDAMWIASTTMSISFSYVRKCVYHHTDVGI